MVLSRSVAIDEGTEVTQCVQEGVYLSSAEMPLYDATEILM